jgi:hypothetical protein
MPGAITVVGKDEIYNRGEDGFRILKTKQMFKQFKAFT